MSRSDKNERAREKQKREARKRAAPSRWRAFWSDPRGYMSKQSKRTRRQREERKKSRLTWNQMTGGRGKRVLLIVVCLFLLFFFPSAATLRANLWLAVALYGVLSVMMLVRTWLGAERPPVAGKIVSTVVAAGMWLPLICSRQALLLADMALLLMLLGYVGWEYFFRAYVHEVFKWEIAVFYLFAFSLHAPYYEFIGAKHLWLFPTVIALLAAGGALLINRFDGREHTKNQRVGAPIVAGMLALAFTVTAVSHLNYALDRGEPIVYETAITEMRQSSGGGRYSVRRYYVTVELEGQEVELQVSHALYAARAVGNRLTVSRYEGALGFPFYMAEEP